MTRRFQGFLRLPSELQFEILWHCLVVPEPVALAYSGLRFAVGGRFLVEHPRFFCILQTSRLVRLQGRALFLRYNTFVFGDFFFESDYFQDRFREARRYSPWLWTDTRICSHPRSEFCSHLDLDEGFSGSSRCDIDVNETLGFSLDPSALDDIRHLIIVHRYVGEDNRREPPHFQVLVLLEKLICVESKLASLFIFTEQRHDAPSSTPSSTPLVGDPRLDVLGRTWDFLPGLVMLCEQLPGLHVHISCYGHGPEVLRAGPVGPLLCADSAASARSYLSARALGGDVDGARLTPGLSLSNIEPDTSFATSGDGRYLLEFGQTESYAFTVPESEGVQLDFMRRSDFRRAHLWHDHRGLLEWETPWFQYDLVDAGGGGRSALSMLRSLGSSLQLRLAARSPGPPWGWKPCLLPSEILERLLDPDRPGNEYVESEGDDLRTVVAEWASLLLEDVSETESECENEHLYRVLMAKALFDGGAARRQRRITDFFRAA